MVAAVGYKMTDPAVEEPATAVTVKRMLKIPLPCLPPTWLRRVKGTPHLLVITTAVYFQKRS